MEGWKGERGRWVSVDRLQAQSGLELSFVVALQGGLLAQELFIGGADNPIPVLSSKAAL